MISQFLKKYVTPVDWIFLSLFGFGVFLSVTFLLLNQFDFHFTSAALFASNVPFISIVGAVFCVLFGFVLLIQGMYTRELTPRSSNFMWTMGLFFFALLLNVLFATALQSTPFQPIDHLLANIDSALGINTPNIMAWTHHHIFIFHALNFAYGSLVWQLMLVPFFLGIFNTRKSIGVFFIAEMSTFIIGGLIYYFFPTMAPSGIFHSHYFSAAQHDTSLRFYDVHHFLRVPTDKGGLIAFPSFHVVWAILIAYSWINKKMIFYPLAFFNLIVITSTVFLGWHYFVDVVGGVVLAMLGIYFAEWIWGG